jgi:hypothetical protein
MGEPWQRTPRPSTLPRTFLTPPQYLSPLPSPAPPSIHLLISLGKKYTPDLGTTRTLETIQAPATFSRGETVLGKPSLRSLAGELVELRRVLLWDMFFQNVASRSLLSKLFIPSSRSPPEGWLRAHRDEVQRLDATLAKHQHAMLAFATAPLIIPSHPALTLNWKEIDLFFQHSLLVEGDKDSSLALVSIQSYQATVKLHLASCHPRLRTPNYALLDPNPHNVAHWEAKGETWQNFIFGTVETLFKRPREPTQDQLLAFLDRQPSPKLPKFYMLAKTHKLKPGQPWGGRPIVGMARWASTGVSRWLGVLAQLLLRLDGVNFPLQTPLQDALDLTHRLKKILPSHADACMTTVDFEGLYTNLTLEDALRAVSFWEGRWREGTLPLEAIPEVERDLIRISFTRISTSRLEEILQQPELVGTLKPEDSPTLAHFFMACVFKFSIFVAPGLGIYKQSNSFSMGTNCAPAWANAILRMLEIQATQRLGQFYLFSRYIDDILIIHPPMPTADIVITLARVYPNHLPFVMQQVGVHRYVHFLDLFILTLYPLTHAVAWKATHKGVYIPWNSNTPRATKLAWVRGETIRLLRLSSAHQFFDIAKARLVACLRRLGYPLWTYYPEKIGWEDRDLYLKYSPKVAQTTHLLRVPYHQRLAIPWGQKIGSLRQELKLHPNLNPNQKLYLSLKPQPALKQIIHGKMMKALERTAPRPQEPNENRPMPPNATAFVRAFYHVVHPPPEDGR